MSILSTITDVLKLIPGVTSAIEAISNAVRKPKAPTTPIPFGRKHAWRLGINPVTCAYCHQTRTVANRDTLCVGPEPVK